MVNVDWSAKTAFCYSSVQCSCSWANTRHLSLLTALTIGLRTALLFLRPLNVGDSSPLYSMHAADSLGINLSSLKVDAAKQSAGSNEPWPCWPHLGENLHFRVLGFRCPIMKIPGPSTTTFFKSHCYRTFRDVKPQPLLQQVWVWSQCNTMLWISKANILAEMRLQVRLLGWHKCNGSRRIANKTIQQGVKMRPFVSVLSFFSKWDLASSLFWCNFTLFLLSPQDKRENQVIYFHLQCRIAWKFEKKP